MTLQVDEQSDPADIRNVRATLFTAHAYTGVTASSAAVGGQYAPVMVRAVKPVIEKYKGLLLLLEKPLPAVNTLLEIEME